MSTDFRDLFLRKIASGTHTSKNLTRPEAAAALIMILKQEATPAQIGAFLIAHRIKRPTGEEIAGMLDAYDSFGGKLAAVKNDRPTIILGAPYDGRSRTAPISPITALVLAAAGINVIMHGGDRMPTKFGIPFIEIWANLGLNWQNLTLAQIEQILAETGLGFVYLPDHFPLAQALVTFRAQIGKRPPLATLELMWAPYKGDAHIACGFVHPPTETTMRAAFELRNCSNYTTIKGLEGSCDLPRDRSVIIGLAAERLIINARDFGFGGFEVPLASNSELVCAELAKEMQAAISGVESEYWQSLVWNSGFYLWRLGVCASLESGFALAKDLIGSGKVKEKLAAVKTAINSFGN